MSTERRLRSNYEYGTFHWAVRRAQWRALGIGDEDLEKEAVGRDDVDDEVAPGRMDPGDAVGRHEAQEVVEEAVDELGGRVVEPVVEMPAGGGSQLSLRDGGRRGVEHRHQQLAIGNAIGIGLDARILRPLGVAGDRRQGVPFGLCEAGEGQPPIFPAAGIDAMRRCRLVWRAVAVARPDAPVG